MHWDRALERLNGNMYRSVQCFLSPLRLPNLQLLGEEKFLTLNEEGVYFYFYTELYMIIAKLVIFIELTNNQRILDYLQENPQLPPPHSTHKNLVCPRVEKEIATVK